MRKYSIAFFCAACIIGYYFMVTTSSCAQIGAPTGGPKDSIAPVLLKAFPAENTTNFKGDKITLQFNEYIDVREIQSNLIVSPFPKTNPTVNFKLKTITVKLKDTLLANTTYAINFGNAIVDNNEGNPFKNYAYVFSTGPTIDSLQLSGKVVLAESGKVDSTFLVLLYKNNFDSVVKTKKPDFLTKLNGQGKFNFTNLAQGYYQIYALKDGDGSKTYNSKVEPFAFLDTTIFIQAKNNNIELNAFAEEQEKKAITASTTSKTEAAKKLQYTVSLSSNTQSILTPLTLSFNKKLSNMLLDSIMLVDTNYQKISTAKSSIDSTKKNITITNSWEQDQSYKLIVTQGAVIDTANGKLLKNDTIVFKTKKTSDYGSLQLRFTGLDTSKHFVVQFLQNDEVVKSATITSNIYNEALMEPGEYELRILFDTNNNSKWDTGNFTLKKQPEKAITLDKKLTIKANWENERDIQL